MQGGPSKEREALTITIDEYNSIRRGDLLKLRQPASDTNYQWDCPYVRVSDAWDNHVYVKVYWSHIDVSRTHHLSPAYRPEVPRIHQLNPTYGVGPDTIEQIVERSNDAN